MRKSTVKRTFLTTEVDVLCVDTNLYTLETKSLILQGTYKDNQRLLKKVREIIDTETFKAIKILRKSIIETPYCIETSLFIKYALGIEN